MTRTHKVMALLAGLLLMALAGCVSTRKEAAEENFGIQQGVSYTVLVGNTQSGIVGEGSVFLFFGSVESKPESSLRMGYTSAAGKSYLLDIPTKNIEFIATDPNVEPSAQFTFDSTSLVDDSLLVNLQEIIDGGLTKVVVTITPDQWNQLVTG